MAKRRRAQANPELREIVASLLSDRADPAELIELFYWSQEPNLLPAIRSLVGMNQETRAAICAYLAIARNPAKVTARMNEHGALLLSTPEVAEIDSALQSATKDGKRALIN